MKNQALFSSKDKSKKLKCCLLQFLFGVLRVNPEKAIEMHELTHFIFVWKLLLLPSYTSLPLNSFNTINQAGSFGNSVSLALPLVGVECNCTLSLAGVDFNGELSGLVLCVLSICDVLLLKHVVSVCNHGHQYLCSATGSKDCFS